jgi:hypothetical protein
MKTYMVETAVGTIRTYQVQANSKKDVPSILACYGHPKAKLISGESIGTETITKVKKIKLRDAGTEVFKNLGTSLIMGTPDVEEPFNVGGPYTLPADPYGY